MLVPATVLGGVQVVLKLGAQEIAVTIVPVAQIRLRYHLILATGKEGDAAPLFFREKITHHGIVVVLST